MTKAKDNGKHSATVQSGTHPAERYLNVRSLIGDLIDSILLRKDEIEEEAEKIDAGVGFYAAGGVVAVLGELGYLAPGIPSSCTDIGLD